MTNISSQSSNNLAKVVVVGSINVDFISYLKEFPLPAQTILAKSSTQALGGKGLNQAVAAACAGGSVSMVGCLGNDQLATQVTDYLCAKEVNADYIRAVDDEMTGTASIFVTEQGENMIVVNSGANNHLSVADVRRAEQLIASANVLLVQLESPADTVREALLLAKKHHVLSILNPAPAADFAKELLSIVDIVTPNETETFELVGIKPDSEENSQLAADKLMQAGVKNVVITKGSDGCFIASDGFAKAIPAFKVHAKDTTGAGDVLNGALAAKLATGLALEQAVHQASAAAAISVLRATAQAAPTNEEIMSFLEQQQT